MKKSLTCFKVLCILFLLLFFPGQGVFADQKVNIYTTNDIHGNVEATETNIGLPQTAAIAASNENSVLIDAGDATQGASFASVTQGEDIIKLMNAAGYDFMALGNHEFDYGLDQLEKNIELADFPVLSANVLKDGKPLTDSSTIIEVGGKKIGLIGLTTTSTKTSTNPDKLGGISFEDEISAAKSAIAKLNDVDTIIIVSHLGNNSDAVSCTSQKLLDGLDTNELSKVSALIDGHSHTVEDNYYTRENIKLPIVQTGCYLTKVGHLSLDFKDTGDVSGSVDLIDYDAAKNYQLNDNGQATLEKVNSTLDEIKKSQSQILDEIICENNTPLWGGYIYYDYAEPRIVETNYGDFVTDAFKEYGTVFSQNNKIDLPVIGIENGGGISATLNAGQVKRGDILNAFNHGNMVEALKVSPSELYSALESGLVVTGQDENGTLQRERVSGSFGQVSGMTYSYDPTAESGKKITEIVLDNNDKLDRNDTEPKIIMVTNSYVASAFTQAEKLGELGGEDMIIEEYLLSKTNNGTTPLSVPISAERIKLINDKSPEEYSVEIPIVDVSTASDENPVALPGAVVTLSIDGEDSQTYQADENGKVTVKLKKGPHTLTAKESADNVPVYVNNYSGSGTTTTKPGYYKLNFAIKSDRIPTEAVSIDKDSLVLTTKDGKNTAQLVAKVTPENTTDKPVWTSSDSNIVEVDSNGKDATLKAKNEGEATVTIVSGDKSANIKVKVSDAPVIFDDLVISTDNYDNFNATAKNVRPNPALDLNGEVGDVCLYAWSNSNQSDIAAVHAKKDDNSNDWSYTFSVNGTKVNTYFNNASKIRIHAYASLSNSSPVFIGLGEHNYAKINQENNLVVTPYAQNIGFIIPSKFENTVAGTVGENRALEGIRLSSPIEGLELNYSVHAQNIGWMNPVTNGIYAGTMRENRHIEAIRITLSGENAKNYSVKYQVHAQNIGWMNPVTDGEIAGTTGENRQIEAVRIELVKK